MFRTKVISDFKEVDEIWVFTHYLGLTEQLSGQSVNMLSPLTPEKDPSFFLFYENDRYYFKDFSLNVGGDCYALIQYKFGYQSKSEAVSKVWHDYEQYMQGNAVELGEHSYDGALFKKRSRFHLKDYAMRKWTNWDFKYWAQYGIGAELLEQHNVSSLSSVKMVKVDEQGVYEFFVQRELLYGYFDKRGELYMVYQPGNKPKFLKVKEVIQGLHLITGAGGNNNLLITKSLKDIMGFKTLGIPDYDVIAPATENSNLPPDLVNWLKNDRKYKKITTLFDTDDAGKRASEKYQIEYGFNPINWNLAKDLTDALADWSSGYVKVKLLKEL